MKSTSASFRIQLFCGAMLLIPVYGQGTDVFHARITGGEGERGLCTAVVDVDGVAEVEIHGDQGRLHTISGAPSTWLKLECTRPLPSNPIDFHFNGVDGRGPQVLLKEPKDNRGAALIRIEDPRNGREGYTFQIQWRGAAPVESGRDGLNWHDQLDFRAHGDGYFRNFRGQDEILSNCELLVSPSGEVRVTFDTNHKSRLMLTGRLTRAERNRLTADMSVNGIDGVMQIQLSGRDRVTEVSMSGQGRDRFELSWRR